MPAFNVVTPNGSPSGSNLTPTLDQGQSIAVWLNEGVVANQLSLQVGLPPSRYPKFFSVELQFSANPGAFEVDVLTSDTDLAPNYVKLSALTVVNGTWVGRIEVVNSVCKFVVLKLVSITNAVLVSAKISR